MSKTKELLMQLYDRYDAIEGSCNELEEYYRNLEHQYYARSSRQDNSNN